MSTELYSVEQIASMLGVTDPYVSHGIDNSCKSNMVKWVTSMYTGKSELANCVYHICDYT